ncbi:MAG: 3' terminal RNA ribose 2'-O-methyltransferase Hen1 [Anaerolineaceae bacterium]|nr:3' terminal RNA ribose 2'-O-methyltransferase Hen1 [Anaerolineaceae bacterium]
MIFTLSTTHTPATDLGFLLYKHPDRLQTFQLRFGQAHVYYPLATPEKCTAALLLDIDPIQLFRSQKVSGNSSFALRQYVNDRPYVASSLLSVAIAQVYGSALSGVCKSKPELAARELPFEASLSVLPSRGGEDLLHHLFEPLGYDLKIHTYPLDARFPEWGPSEAFTVELRSHKRLQDLLAHLYVLIPVLDDDKHYYVGEDEIDKLLARGEGWLASHPARQLIVERYLRHRRKLTASALSQLREEDAPDEAGDEQSGRKEEGIEKSTGLHQQRLEAVVDRLHASGARRVADLGCGEGRLIGLLLPDGQFTQVLGMDVSARSLSEAAYRLQLDRLPGAQRRKLTLIQGSLLYRDRRLAGYEAVTLVEVIEHLDPARLEVVERVVFGQAQPGLVILTTPNREYNRLWPGLPAGELRHPDHHFEWTRAEFQSWAEGVAGAYGYGLAILPVGSLDPQAGPPTQMAVFTREGRGA